jgi:hypothetical protein
MVLKDRKECVCSGTLPRAPSPNYQSKSRNMMIIVKSQFSQIKSSIYARNAKSPPAKVIIN